MQTKHWELLGNQEALLITASNRQSRHWQQQYHRWQSQQSDVWPSAAILSFSQWQHALFLAFSQELPFAANSQDKLNQSQDDSNSDHKKPKAPVLLNPQQSQWLWESILRKHEVADYLISIKATAHKVQEAWQLLNQWQLSVDQVNPETQDHRAMIRWAKDYQDQLSQNHWLDDSQLLNWLQKYFPQPVISEGPSAPFSTHLLPKHLLLLGFHQLTPQQEEWLAFLKEQNISVEFVTRKSPTTNTVLARTATDFNNELLAATTWVKQQLIKQPDGQFAVVVPDLDKTRYQVEQVFLQQLHPELMTQPVPDRMAFNLSVGEPMMSYSMTRVAVYVIALLGQEISQNKWAEILRSELTDLWRACQVPHRTLAFNLAESGRSQWRWRSLVRWLSQQMARGDDSAHQPNERLEKLNQFQQSVDKRQSPEQWSVTFMEWLNLWGMPGDATLNSREFQLYEQLVQKIQSLRQFNTVQQQSSFGQAFGLLRTLIDGESFQPKAHGEPIQVLGLYEAVGLTFDGIWLSGLSSEVLPEAAKPNPFLPLSFARKHSLPGSGPERELEFAKSLLKHLTETSDELCVSYYQQQQEQVLGPSPLLQPLLEAKAASWQVAEYDQNLLLSAPAVATEYFADDWGEGYSDSTLDGGSSFLQAQSICPMQGYLSYRLRLEEQASEAVGIDPRERGIFVHQVMQKIWLILHDQETLLAKSEHELLALVHQVVEELLSHRFLRQGLLKQLEQEKFVPLIVQLLQLETKRRSFKVLATEQKVTISLNGLEINARLDRVDQHDEGDQTVLDYKTGQVSTSQWFTQRLGEPQLPLYLLSNKEQIRALCFAQLHHKDVKMAGVAESGDTIPAIKAIQDARLPVASWREFIEQVEGKLIQITNEIKQGYAAVDPTSELHACQYCPFDSICRVGELEAVSQSDAFIKHESGGGNTLAKNKPLEGEHSLPSNSILSEKKS